MRRPFARDAAKVFSVYSFYKGENAFPRQPFEGHLGRDSPHGVRILCGDNDKRESTSHTTTSKGRKGRAADRKNTQEGDHQVDESDRIMRKHAGLYLCAQTPPGTDHTDLKKLWLCCVYKNMTLTTNAPPKRAFGGSQCASHFSTFS